MSRTYTMEEGINSAGFGYSQLKLVAITGFFQAADAMELMMLSFLGPAVQCQWNLSDAEVSALTTVVFVGMLFGTYFWGIFADRYGRWTALFYDCITVFLFAMLSAGSVNYGMLMFARAMVGFGLGGFGVSWSYFLEFIPTAKRGRWACIMLGWWSIGTVLEAGLAWAILPTIGWRWLLVISAAPLLIVLGGLFFLPESPRYYLVIGKSQKAEEILKEIAGGNKTSLPEGTLVGGTVEQDVRASPIQTLRIIWSPKWSRLTGNLWLLWFANAFCYYGLVLMTTTLRYADTDEDICARDHPFTDEDYIDVFIATAAEIPGLALALVIVDRIGRKLSQALLFGGTAVFILLLIPLDHQTNADVAILFFARMLITGAFTVTYLYTPEVYPTNIRGTAFGFANSFARIGGMLCPFVAQDLLQQGHAWATELIFAFFCIMATIAAVRLPVETAGKAMADVADANTVELPEAKRERTGSEVYMKQLEDESPSVVGELGEGAGELAVARVDSSA